MDEIVKKYFKEWEEFIDSHTPEELLEYEKSLKLKSIDYIPEPCKKCNNHPINGGPGICHCILGNQAIKV